MNICLYVPKLRGASLTAPMGVLYIASQLISCGHDVFCVDGRLTDKPVERILDYEPDMLCVTATTPAFPDGVRVASAVKASSQGCVIVFGGAHPTATPQTVVEYGAVDYVVVGEGEKPMREIGGGHNPSTVNNVCYLNGGYHSNRVNDPLTPGELDMLPYPAYFLLDLKKYFSRSNSHGLYIKDPRHLPVMSSRGCPNACAYCQRMMGYGFRGRSPESVVGEIEYLVGEYGVREIHLEDDNFTHDRSRAVNILKKLIDLDLGVHLKLSNGMRADKTDPELFKLLVEAGGYFVGFGVESGSQRILDEMRKGIKKERVSQAIGEAKDAGLLVGGSFIVGYPGETYGDVVETIDFALTNPLDSASISMLVPFPGTHARSLCEPYARPDYYDFSKYVFLPNEPFELFETPELSYRGLCELVKVFHRRFYMRPSFLFKSLGRVTPSQIMRGVVTLTK